jgi:hypothetical protein
MDRRNFYESEQFKKGAKVAVMFVLSEIHPVFGIT